jgi:hypothetical protein
MAQMLVARTIAAVVLRRISSADNLRPPNHDAPLPLRRCGPSISPSHDNSLEHVSEVPPPPALTFH